MANLTCTLHAARCTLPAHLALLANALAGHSGVAISLSTLSALSALLNVLLLVRLRNFGDERLRANPEATTPRQPDYLCPFTSLYASLIFSTAFLS